MIIDRTFFEKEPLLIPNLTSLEVRGATEPAQQGVIDRFIELCERDLLINALGITLFDELTIEAAKDPITPGGGGAAAQKWIDLVDGRNYTISAIEHRWEGLRGFSKNSLIAYFIFTSYLMNKDGILTTLGVVQPKASISENLSSTPKFINAWQTFISMYQGTSIHHPLIIHNRFGIGIDHAGSSINAPRSLFQYLTDTNTLDPTSFPNLTFGKVALENSFNSFGI